jgi:hypothetical protein
VAEILNDMMAAVVGGAEPLPSLHTAHERLGGFLAGARG